MPVIDDSRRQIAGNPDLGDLITHEQEPISAYGKLRMVAVNTGVAAPEIIRDEALCIKRITARLYKDYIWTI